MTHPLEYLDKQTLGAAGIGELAKQVGYAVTTWGMIEEELACLLAAALNHEDSIGRTILANVVAFRGQINIVRSVMVKTQSGKTDTLDYWHRAHDYIVELSGDRNNLAHSPLTFHMQCEHTNFSEAPIPLIGPSWVAKEIDNEKRTIDASEAAQLCADFWEAKAQVRTLTDFIRSGADDSEFPKQFSRRRLARGQRPGGNLQKQKKQPHRTPSK